MKKLFASLGSLFTFARKNRSLREGFAPYADKNCNQVYNLLFCDKVTVFRREFGAAPQGAWETLLATEPHAAGLKAIADDASQESRARLLACRRLREQGQAVGPPKLLGVVVEVALPDGLDVLAAYPDGSVHYIHHRGTHAVFAPAPGAWQPTVLQLLNAAQAAVDRIGPWEKPRVAPPTPGMIRMSFLVSDGLYFGQGLLDVMQKDELAGPIIAAGTELLKSVAHRIKFAPQS
jgi:hypothetical protein